MNNQTDGMSYEEYRALPEAERKALWKSNQTRREAVDKAKRDAEPSKSDDETLLAEVQARIESLKSKGVKNTRIFEKKAAELSGRIAADADLVARMESADGVSARQAFSEQRSFLLANGSTDEVIAHDAACEYYFSAGGTGEPLSDDYAKAIATFVKVKLRVENAAEAAANQAQAAADMAQRQADLKAHDANKLKSGDAATVKSGDDNEGGETNE